MALDGLLALVCAAALTAAPPESSPPASDARDTALATTLAVQTALQQGREHLLHGDARAAVAALESQLAYINGNQLYLKVLQDAYRAYIKELRLLKQEAEVQRYLRRLLILDRGALLDATLVGTAAAPQKKAPSTSGESAPPAQPAPSGPAKPAPTVRLKSEDDPFRTGRSLDKPSDRAQTLLSRAEEEFGRRHYHEARLLYEQAYQTDQKVTASSRERWAYCKLFCVVEQMNQAGEKPSWPDLEKEVRVALDLAPRLEYGKSLLAEIQKRCLGGTTTEAGKDEPTIPVRHLSRTEQGWDLAETTNFRIFHSQSRELAEEAARVVELTRAHMQQKWFGAVNESWNPKCDIYLYPKADDYTRATEQTCSPGHLPIPGHSSIRMESGRVVIRRIEAHCENPNMVLVVLPHETTHIVLAGQFGEQLAPRWADEGMAVLTEPRDQVERHLANLVRSRQDGQLFQLQTLMQLENYPQNPRQVSAFYAQSVSLVEFLCGLRGAQEFTLFLHDGMRYGYEKSLQRHYNYRSFAELEERWSQHAFRDQWNLTGGVAEAAH